VSQIVQYPAAILREPCKPVTVGSKAAREIADELRLALRMHRRKGVALAANQIGHTVTMFVLDTGYLKLKCPSVFVNPQLTFTDMESDVEMEYCLSFPESVGIPVKRTKRVTVTAFDDGGAQFSVELEGLAARCAQHEAEHLLGKTILDHATPAQKKKVMKAIVAALKKVAKK
jgi:peptide deformylase